MKIKNRILFGLFMLALFALLAGTTDASVVTINSPSASSTIFGQSNFSVSVDEVDSGWNCTIYVQSTLTANNTWALLGGGVSVSNDTALIWNATLDTAVVEDANNYVVNASCINETATVEDTNTGITIDNSVPTAATSLSPSDKTTDTDGSVTFSGTVLGANTTSCTLEFSDKIPPTGNSQSMTHTGNTCSLTLSNLPDEVYTWYIRASDELNTTDSSSVQSIVYVSSGSAASGLSAASPGETVSASGSTFTVGGDGGILGGLSTSQILIGLAVVFVVGWFILKKK